MARKTPKSLDKKDLEALLLEKAKEITIAKYPERRFQVLASLRDKKYLCAEHGNPYLHRCELCVEDELESRDTQQKLLASWEVGKCRKHPFVSEKFETRYCYDCLEFFFKNKSRAIFNRIEHWKELLQIAKRQNWKCSYTDEILIPDLNMSHDLKSTEKKIEGIHWITTKMKRFKGEMLHDDFVTLCVNVTENTKTEEEKAEIEIESYLPTDTESTESISPATNPSTPNTTTTIIIPNIVSEAPLVESPKETL